MAATRKCLSTDEEFWQAVAESLSVRQVVNCIGLVPAGVNYKTVHNRIKLLQLGTSHFTGAWWHVGDRYKSFERKITLAEIMVTGSLCNFSQGLKNRLLKEWVKSRCCE